MKKKINGVEYNTENAEGIANHDAEDGKTASELYRTTEGKYFLETRRLQVHYRGAWRDTLMDGSARPLSKNHDDYRFVGTIKPFSEEEAIDWVVETQVPECLATVIQDRLGKLVSFDLGKLAKPLARYCKDKGITASHAIALALRDYTRPNEIEKAIVHLQGVLLKRYGKVPHPCGQGYSDCTLYIAHNEVNLTNEDSHVVAEDAVDAATVLSEAKAA